MKPTRPSVLFAVAVVAGAVGYLLARRYYLSARAPVSWYQAVILFVLAGAELVVAQGIRTRLRRRPGTRAASRPIHPIAVARAAVLAKASSPVGALAAGGYGGLALYLGISFTDVPVHDLWVAVVAALSGAALTGAALVLEWVCRVPRPKGPTAPGTQPSGAGAGRERSERG